MSIEVLARMGVRPGSGLLRGALLIIAAALLSACGSSARRADDAGQAQTPATTASRPAGGGYYLDDGPDARPPANLEATPDAVPRPEPLHRFANRPYTVLGQSFVPMQALRPFREVGHGSWYGRRFHGKPTSSGEPYDMYAMTAAHPTLPIPSYARVKNVGNGRSVVVRINDRGPFLRGRIIDLSYTAAHKLGYVNAGSAQLEVELILPPALAGHRSPAQPAPAAAGAGLGSGLVPELASASAGIFLQLGAFASRRNAEEFKASVAQDVAAHATDIELFSDGEHFRLHAGPYATVEDARHAAAQLGNKLKLKPFVILR